MAVAVDEVMRGGGIIGMSPRIQIPHRTTPEFAHRNKCSLLLHWLAWVVKPKTVYSRPDLLRKGGSLEETQYKATPRNSSKQSVKEAVPLLRWWVLKSGQLKMATKVKLESADKCMFTVDVEVAKMSDTVKVMIETLGLEGRGEGDSGEDLEVIPLPNVNGETLGKIIEWAEYHRNDSPSVSDIDYSERRNDLISTWDSDFLKAEHDKGTLVSLVLAANYLDIRGLLEMACTTVANFMIKGRTPEEIRAKFRIVNDLTPEEENQIRAENAWCEDK